MFDKILVVCIGNICRSPTAEFILQEKLPDKQVASAGLFAMAGKDMDAQARQMGAEHGYSFPSHTARQFDAEFARNYDLILVMESGHRTIIAERFPEALAKTMLLGKWQGDKEIPDPYRKSDEVFRHVFNLIETSSDLWASKLK